MRLIKKESRFNDRKLVYLDFGRAGTLSLLFKETKSASMNIFRFFFLFSF